MYTLAQHVQKRLVGYNTPQMVVSQQTKQRREEEERERQMKEKREAEQRRSEYEVSAACGRWLWFSSVFFNIYFMCACSCIFTAQKPFCHSSDSVPSMIVNIIN